MSLMGLGMAAFPRCIDETRRPGMQARRSVASLAALRAVCDGRRDYARASSAERFRKGRPPNRSTDAFGGRTLSRAYLPFTAQILMVRSHGRLDPFRKPSLN